MKKFLSYSLLAAAASAGVSLADTATTPPVGYESLSLTKNAFNYLGLRLHESVVVSGKLTGVNVNSGINVQDTAGNFSSLSANTLYLLEIVGTSGVVAEFLGSNVSGTTITLVDNLQTAGVQSGAQYRIRPAATLASVFGATNSAGLAAGTLSPTGADTVLIPNGSGGFNSYYYDNFGGPSFTGGWKNAATLVDVTASAVALSYLDGLMISAGASAPATITVSGSVKTDRTRVALSGSSFSYLSSLAPAGGTLANAINPDQLDKGTLSPAGADQVLIPTPTGFASYYYDSFGGPSFSGGWKNAATLADVDPATVPINSSGLLISNAGAAANITLGVPDSYSGL